MSRSGRGRLDWLVLGGAFALYVLTAGGSLTSTDAVVTFDLTSSIVERHSIALPGNVLGLEANRGVDGRFYSQYGIGQSLYNVPFYLAGRTATRIAPRHIGKPDTLVKAAVAMGSAVAAAITVWLIWSLSLRLGMTRRASLAAAGSAAVCSPLWPYSKFGFSTALTAAILVAAARLLLESQLTGRARYAAAAGAVLGFGWLTRHEMALALIPFSAAILLRAREERSSIPLGQLVALAAAACVGGVFWGWYNFVRFGSPFTVGYSPEMNFSGYAAFLFAPAGSILLFAPIAVLWGAGLARPGFDTSTRVLLAGPLVAFYAMYGSLADWPGGRSYGPRYLVPALILLAPGMAALWDSGRRRRTLVTVCACAAILQLPGVVVDYAKVSTEWARSHSSQEVASRNWRFSSSPLILGAEAAVVAVPANIAYLTGLRQHPSVAVTSTADDRDFAQHLSFSLDFWWLYLVYLHAVRPLPAVAFAVALALGALLSARLAWTSAAAAG